MKNRPALGALLIAILATLTPASAVCGDAEQGRKLYNKCKGCHRTYDGFAIGPNFKGVFGRTAATAPRFRYSEALSEAGRNGLVWTNRSMAAYITDPRGFLSSYASSPGRQKHKALCKEERGGFAVGPGGAIITEGEYCGQGYSAADMDDLAAHLANE